MSFSTHKFRRADDDDGLDVGGTSIECAHTHTHGASIQRSTKSTMCERQRAAGDREKGANKPKFPRDARAVRSHNGNGGQCFDMMKQDDDDDYNDDDQRPLKKMRERMTTSKRHYCKQ